MIKQILIAVCDICGIEKKIDEMHSFLGYQCLQISPGTAPDGRMWVGRDFIFNKHTFKISTKTPKEKT